MKEYFREKMLELLHGQQYKSLHDLLEEMNTADIAEIFQSLDDADMIIAYRLLNKDDAVEVFAELENEDQEKLINALTDKELYEVTSNLLADDAADLIEEMPSNVVKRILRNTDSKKRAIINQLLNYPEDSAGSYMTVEFVDLKANMTVRDAFTRIRKIGFDTETVYTCYVLSSERVLEGIVTLKELLLADYDTKLRDMMETNLITVHTHDDIEFVAKQTEKYGLITMPVVDGEERLVGIITIDDVLEVIQDETTEDFELMNALAPAEDTYFRTTVWEHSKNRIVWLLVLMLSSAITGTIITKYEMAFEAIPALVGFIPMLMNTGGNCGSQSSTLVIRGMAVDEIHLRDFFKVLWKEIRISVLVGVVLCVLNMVRIMIQYQDFSIAFVVSITLFVIVMVSQMLGCCLPMLARRLKMDPAIMAAPLITTVVDTCSVLVYFSIAVRVLNIG
ncbi:MAG TPA: magnesium transporter [Candidatus Fimimorpha faecalis]|uniref:Magnesium transporter MgtE n=1 Tax=Candidatus Fimimorpha faecalis TaxID=2840824 RepID=A0A9D1EEZ7_9FIRM|nr:magnesium transporter [Candidatus Fimimorpha faecalis]